VTEPFPVPPFVHVSPSFVDASLPKCEPSDESGHLSR
jgi:hypothetical protein